jgi:hypothetical protein
VYEIKSFTSRLTSAHKRQISNSLKTAIAKQPRLFRWTLVLPRDRTPAVKSRGVV